MSSTTRFRPTPPPPPPPKLVEETGMTQISLRDLIGKTMEGNLMETLEGLSADHARYVSQELGLSPESAEARVLAWKKTADGPGRIRQYSLKLTADQLDPGLRTGTNPSLTVQLQVGGGNVRISHDYFTTVRPEQVASVRQKLTDSINRSVIGAFNPLLATTVSQALKHKAQQKLQPRLKQQHKLQTRVTQNFNHQTVALVQAVNLY